MKEYEKNVFRAPAVPLITHDPYFSIWSCATNLTDDTTRAWDGVRRFLFGLIVVDGQVREFLGRLGANAERYYTGYPKLEQTSCRIRATTTTYTFAGQGIALELSFISPLLPDDLSLLSRPISYISYGIRSLDGQPHQITIHFGVSAEMCVEDLQQEVWRYQTPLSTAFTSGYDRMLQRMGDDQHVEWGSLHVIAPEHEMEAMTLRAYQKKLSDRYSSVNEPINYRNSQGPRMEKMGTDYLKEYEHIPVYPQYPLIALSKTYELKADQKLTDHFALGYEDDYSLVYYGKKIRSYCHKNGESFLKLMGRSVTEYEEIRERCRRFDDALEQTAREAILGLKSNSDYNAKEKTDDLRQDTVWDRTEESNSLERTAGEYAQIVALAYRQAVAGHKLTWDEGELQFVSKENFSNGCAATVDVTYPSIPLFLLYEPKLVEGMLNPIFRMIDEGLWIYPFAPHDAGAYPLVNGQVYGFSAHARRSRPDPYTSQMPVEECGNMILTVAALCKAEGSNAYFNMHRDILADWADYLVETGYNPENQLCTDDFAGHLAHNCNLSLKAICALGAIALLFEQTGEKEKAASYRKTAEKFAALWQQEAFEKDELGGHYRLAFDQPGTWSLKYNLVWDHLLDLQLFPKEVYDRELTCYQTHLEEYGIPLDCRSDTTKTDWEMWTTCLFEDPSFSEAIIHRMYRMLCETEDRVPFTDMPFASRPIQREFQARTVQGGLFLPMLKAAWKKRG